MTGRSRLRSGAVVVAAAMTLGVLLAVGHGARAADEAPVFSAPTTIDHVWFPVEPGVVKVFLGRARRSAITRLETHTDTVRTFPFGDTSVACRAVVTRTFVRGVPKAVETAWFAQADDGSVHCFGEVEEGDDHDDDGSDDGPSGWIVGQVQPEDPAGTVSVASPRLRMPAAPIRGDSWIVEELGAEDRQTYRVLSSGRGVRVRAGRFASLRIADEGVDPSDRDTLWFANGVGLVKTIEDDGQRTSLVASTIGLSGTR